jgi:pimeloyl-ACP methyl ester carboxylesterase
VLCHGNEMNASMMFPWYTFLHAAGCNVIVFDPRGFGQSGGTPSLWGWLLDMRQVMNWVRERPDVRADRLALYGIGVGATAALLAAARFGPVAAVIAEDPVSPREHIRKIYGGGAIQTGLIEYAGVPDGSEPDETAALLRVPSLFLGGENADPIDRSALLRTFLAAREPKSLWLMPGTGPAPNSLMTQAGEYQAAVTGFLRVLGGAESERVAVEWKESRGSGGPAIEVTLARRGSSDPAPWAVEVGVADAAAGYTFQRVWLDAERRSFQFKVKAAPGLVTAVRYHDVVDNEDGSGWRPQAPAIERAGQLWQQVADDAELLREGNVDVADVQRVAGKIRQLEREGPFPPELEAMLAATYCTIGRQLVVSSEPTVRAEGIAWLRRAIAAAPPKPSLWFWPGATVIYGFPHGEAVATARTLLARYEGG